METPNGSSIVKPLELEPIVGKILYNVIPLLNLGEGYQVDPNRFLKPSLAKTVDKSTNNCKTVLFFEWFFEAAEMVNKYLSQMWNDGHIYGFCNDRAAEDLLNCCSHPTLLVRFSVYEYGKIKISLRGRDGSESRIKLT